MGEQLELFSSVEYERPPADAPLCMDCGIDTLESGDWYMLLDEVWLEANPADVGLLCLDCVGKRLGRPLTPADFAPVPINRYLNIRERTSRMGMP